MSNEEGIVENLVTQFSSAWDCLRELVQNSIDAGSPQVDVWTEFERGDSHQGVIAIHIDDFGEGMDEHIIDNQLTTLFASAKENDLTKIGKFGIGFVSVFALKPKGVLLHTGRAGEFWEVFFHEDRSFSKTRLDYPVEGTQITLFLEGDYRKYKSCVRDVRSTLQHWCEHSETEISFEDRSPEEGTFPELESINAPFVVEGDCFTHVKHQGTEMVIAYTSSPHYGFYNRGLALAYSRHGEDLLFERAPRYRQIGFKIKSRYLEHTLSRETVMRDVNYEKAMVLLDQAANNELLLSLLSEIETLVAQEQWVHKDAQRYMHLMSILQHEPPSVRLKCSQHKILRTLSGEPLSLEHAYQVWERDGRLLFSQEISSLTARLHTMGVPVIYGDAADFSGAFGAPLRLFDHYASTVIAPKLSSKIKGMLIQVGFGIEDAQSQMRRSLAAPDEAFLPVILHEQVSPEHAQLLASASELLSRIKAGYDHLTLCEMDAYVEESPLFVIARELSPFMARPPANLKHKKGMQVAVNREHPFFRELEVLMPRQPQMAAYMLAKNLLLRTDRLLERDLALMAQLRG